MKFSPTSSFEKPSQPEMLVNFLSKKGWRICFAESCTGGLAAATLVDVPSASNVLDVSFVTYANEAKIEFAGVSPDTLEKFGAVSREVALEMAKGVASRSGAQVGVGISGIAGPSGGQSSKPVGMVCFGFVAPGKSRSETVFFGDVGRNAVRKKSVEYVYQTLVEWLLDKTE